MILISRAYGQSSAKLLLFGPLLVVLLSSIQELAGGEKRVLSSISLVFGALFAATSGIHYFVQLSTVRLSIKQGQTTGLEQFVQANPISGIAGINLLGWTIFMGLASLFAAAAFPLVTLAASRLQRVISAALLLNGLFCLLGGVGYVSDNAPIVFLTLNFGMGGAVLTAVIGMCLLFSRMGREN